MTGKTHQIVGICAGFTYYITQTNSSYNPATLGAVVIGSHFATLLPDIDTAAGKFWQSIPYGKYFGRVIDPFLEHRNLTHSILGIGIVFYGLRYLLDISPDYWGWDKPLLLTVWMIAFISHLLIDMITVQGIPLFFPL